MKKTFVRIAAVAVLVVMLACSLVSCGGLSGTYASDETLGSGVSYTFKGKEVTIEVKLLGFTTELVGEYSIDGDEITLIARGCIHAVEIEAGLVPTDNYFTLLPGEKRTVRLGMPLGEAAEYPVTVDGYSDVTLVLRFHETCQKSILMSPVAALGDTKVVLIFPGEIRYDLPCIIR